MANFQFRLQPVIQLRERARDAAAQAYQQGLQAAQQVEQQITTLRTEYESQRPLQKTSINQTVQPQKVLESQRFQHQLGLQIKELQNTLFAVRQEIEKRRLVLVEAEQKLKSLTKLKERRREEYLTNEQAKEQNALDHWAGIKYWKSQSDPS